MKEVIEVIRTGRIDPAYCDTAASAMRKQPVAGPVRLTVLGLEGDEHADTKHHGGEEKAVFFIAARSYPHFADQAAELGATCEFTDGLFGENVTSHVFNEQNVYIGQIFHWGETTLQVTQGRLPCFKLNEALTGVADFALRLQKANMAGWYMKVLKEGTVKPGDMLTAEEPPEGALTVAQTFLVRVADTIVEEDIRAVLAQPALAKNWRDTLELRLATGVIKSEMRRLYGPDSQGFENG